MKTRSRKEIGLRTRAGRNQRGGLTCCWSAGASFLGGSPGYLNNSIRRAGWNTVRTRWNTLERPKSANTFKLEVSIRMVFCQIDSVNPVCRSELDDEHLKFDSSVCSLSFCRWSVTSTNQNKVNRVQTGAFSSVFDRWLCKRNPCSARVTSQFQYSCSTLGSYQLTMTRGDSPLANHRIKLELCNYPVRKGFWMGKASSSGEAECLVVDHSSIE